MLLLSFSIFLEYIQAKSTSVTNNLVYFAPVAIDLMWIYVLIVWPVADLVLAAAYCIGDLLLCGFGELWSFVSCNDANCKT